MTPAAPSADRGPPADGLVARIGGPARMRAVLEVFYDRLAADPLVGFFFAGRDLGRIVDGQLAFLRRVCGDTDSYTGRHPAVAHRDLPPILRGHFDRRLRILDEVLAEQGVPAADAAIWHRLEAAFRRVVQHRG